MRLARLVLVGLMLAATGCAGDDRSAATGPPASAPSSTTPTGPPASALPSSTPAGPPASAPPSTTVAGGPGPEYRLSGSLCDKADLRALEELWPRARTPLAETKRMCATARRSRSMTVSIGVDAERLPDAEAVRLFLETGRRLSPSPTTDIAGAGTDAYWTQHGRQGMRLVAGHGNLILEVEAVAITTGKDLPDDMPQRLARVADGTFKRLAR